MSPQRGDTAPDFTALDDSGRIVFRYYLVDGRGGIAVATPTMETSSAGH